MTSLLYIAAFAAFCAALPLLLIYVVIDELRQPTTEPWYGD